MLVIIAQQVQENFAVSTTLTMRSRLARWIHLQIKLCGKATGCHTELQGLLDSETGSRFWVLRICQNNACPRNVLNRSVSAAINILYLSLRFAREQGRPAAFRRSNAINKADVVEQVVEVS